jgi:hypothetical protein
MIERVYSRVLGIRHTSIFILSPLSLIVRPTWAGAVAGNDPAGDSLHGSVVLDNKVHVLIVAEWQFSVWRGVERRVTKHVALRDDAVLAIAKPDVAPGRQFGHECLNHLSDSCPEWMATNYQAVDSWMM